MSESKLDDEASYKIQCNDQVGRYLVAGRDLEPGAEILTELPFVVGPKASTYPLCLTCYTPWPPTEDDDNKPLCPRCGWPVCGDECADQPQHRDYECKVFAEAKEKFNVELALSDEQANGVPQLECVTPLRLLLASERDGDRWNREVKDMAAHDKRRSQTAQWNSDRVNIAEYLRTRCKLDRFPEDSVQTACGILEINAHEVRTARGFLARALYPKVSIMSHSCVSNTVHSIVPNDFRVYLRTAVKVPAGGELLGSYTHALLPTLLRREYLQESKYFTCACTRCSDPTELGTHMSSLKCQKCDNGVVVALDSLDAESTWKCTHCEFSTTAQAVLKILKIIQAEMDRVEAYTAADGPEAIQTRENYMKKYRSVFHPRHAMLTIPRYSLSQLYGRVEDYFLDDMPDVVLEHKAEMCRLLLQVLDVVEPGLTRSRGMILYELHAPLLFLAKGQWNAGVIDAAKLKTKMTEAASLLKEAADILAREPQGTPEADIAAGARQALEQLDKSIGEL
ncbi:protein msta [Copidosoma floridanum]|uniref:protein msta n=1 Tax=Copidosoma floridanum TaxID=29053 RepID=UPI0006C9D98F|nr:protein msta [Copidosoma floridanum]